MRSPRCTLVLALMALFLVSCTHATDRRFEKKFSVSAGGKLSLKTDAGSVRVTGSSSDEVSIVADIRGRERMVNGFEITADKDGEGVTVVGRSNKHGSWFFGSNEDLDVEFTVKVPHAYNIAVETSGGNVSVSDVAGSVRAATSGGEAEATSIDGPLDLGTSGGNVKADGVNGEARLETSGGDARARNVKGNVTMSTSGGNVEAVDIEGKVRAETSGGNVRVKVKGPNKGVHAETSGGNIEVVIPKGVGAEIDAGTSGGDVVCDMPITTSGRLSDSHIRGSVNGGGEMIYAHTSGGDVRIRPGE